MGLRAGAKHYFGVHVNPIVKALGLQPWTCSSPKTPYCRAWVFFKDCKQRGFGTLRPHSGGTLDVEGKAPEPLPCKRAAARFQGVHRYLLLFSTGSSRRTSTAFQVQELHHGPYLGFKCRVVFKVQVYATELLEAFGRGCCPGPRSVSLFEADHGPIHASSGLMIRKTHLSKRCPMGPEHRPLIWTPKNTNYDYNICRIKTDPTRMKGAYDKGP